MIFYACRSSPVGIRWEGEEDLPAEVSMEMEAHRSAQRTGVRRCRKLLPSRVMPQEERLTNS